MGDFQLCERCRTGITCTALQRCVALGKASHIDSAVPSKADKVIEEAFGLYFSPDERGWFNKEGKLVIKCDPPEQM